MWEKKYELDSVGYFLNLLYNYYRSALGRMSWDIRALKTPLSCYDVIHLDLSFLYVVELIEEATKCAHVFHW